MFKKISKLFTSMEGKSASQLLHNDTYTENLIENTPGDLLAQSEDGQIFVGVLELNGFFFLEATLLSKIGVKTHKGGTLHFKGGKQDFELKSDTQEMKSEYSNVSRRYMTDISFEVGKDELTKIQKGDYTEVQFSFKKKVLTFQKATKGAIKNNEA
ncbi:MAG: hypothetical protein K0U54_04745 [Bacteroidetes bacterium]|nr:hypothetical protein [Bacteroidota bacterium]